MCEVHVCWQHETRNVFTWDQFTSIKILQAMPLKPQPLRMLWNIRTLQQFLEMNNTPILLHQMFSLK